MTTTIGLLGSQHQEVLSRLAAVEAELDASDPGLAAFSAYLQGEVLEHFTLEEQALFPKLERHPAMRQGPLAVMNAEHAEFRTLLEELTAAVRADARDAQRMHAAEIIALLRAHIHKEDHVLFPLATELLTAEEMADVDRYASELRGGAASAG
jgi:hemerythrin-like domain-containing protein